ncbi:MAG: hypothetical protein AAB726_00150 [Patescibacteria group bacterium]
MSKDTTPESPEVKKFDTDKALNTKGFAEFLADHPDAETFDMNDEGEVQKRFEMFGTKEIAKKGLKELYSTHISSEMGVVLDANDLSSIDLHIEKFAKQNPEEILAMKHRLDLFNGLPGEIAGLEKQLATLGKKEDLTTKIDALKQDKADLEAAREHLGKMGKIKANFKALAFYAKSAPMMLEVLPGVKLSEKYSDKIFEESVEMSERNRVLSSVKEKHGKIGKGEAGKILKDVENKIAEIESVLAKVEEAEEMRSRGNQMLDDARKELLGGISGMAEITAAIHAKTRERFESIMNSESIKGYDYAQKIFEHLKEVSESTETGVNPFGTINEEKLQEDIDISLERVATEQIMWAIEDAEMGANALTKLEKAFAPLLEKNKLGSKEGDEVREFISNIIEGSAKILGNTTEDKAKKLIIARILIKMKS